MIADKVNPLVPALRLQEELACIAQFLYRHFDKVRVYRFVGLAAEIEVIKDECFQRVIIGAGALMPEYGFGKGNGIQVLCVMNEKIIGEFFQVALYPDILQSSRLAFSMQIH